MKIVKQEAALHAWTPNPENVIELSGRICYKSESRITSDSAAKFIRMLLDRGHESVIEHASATLHIITDRGVSHELVRHRIASYSQESTRYCNYGKANEITVIEPPGLDAHRRSEWYGVCEECEAVYMLLVDCQVPPQIARSVLPTCLKTELVATCNFREWRHFLRLRTAKAAHPQMRELAWMIAGELVRIAPTVFSDWATPTPEGE